MKIVRYFEMFNAAMIRWLDLIKHKIDIKVEKSFLSDPSDAHQSDITEFTKFSSSSVELTSCFSQVSKFWQIVSWPELSEAVLFATKLVDDLSKCAMRYADLTSENCQKYLSTKSLDGTNSQKNANIIQEV